MPENDPITAEKRSEIPAKSRDAQDTEQLLQQAEDAAPAAPPARAR